MARISEAEIEWLKNEVSVERLVEGSGVALRKSGKDFVARCPFHEDDTASREALVSGSTGRKH